MNEPITIANREASWSGGKTAYWIQGEKKSSDEPVVLLLHGYCGSSAYWKDVLPLLEPSVKVIAPDFRGHGSSSAPEEEVYTMEALADDISGLLAEAGEKQAVIIGHSLGGYAALAFAERHPDMLHALGLVHSTPLPDTAEGREKRDKAAETIRTEGVEAFVESLVPKLFAPSHLAGMADRVEQAKAIGKGTDRHAAAACALGMKERPDRTEVLRGLDKPVLLLAGDEDQVIGREKTFVAEGSNIEQVLLQGSGHMSMAEQPVQLAAKLNAFISRAIGR
ncbi:alpha/beta hydrolase [Paenibacillus sambharensis]|uniref:Alpha/beta hydrolase n=1 Tax=Paenibacillus sambharensis TaxID=1803190 RepID=A0A2W1L5W9_9BACL|nr:alpha/beta fold hydrolase [Paenibacillus sambharensis]PZD94666.1 alpha/beta hydrolase [Paenibacillus sambharensis]